MIGKTLGHYRILDQLGAGGMGLVYRAHDERLDRDVALKVLPAGLLADEAARKRFRKEALALSKLNQSNIATVHDFDTQDGVDFLVMELVEGETLAHRIESGPLAEKEIMALGSQIADALEEAHENGVIHRDLKPSNIMLTPKGRVKILDFGLAKLLRPAAQRDLTASLTATPEAAGTLPYMPPEQLQGEAVDARSDLYALGAVLYEMSTGQRPFREELSTRLIDAILHRPPVSPRALNARVSPDLERIILKCLQKDPEQRYQSAREVGVDLRGSGAGSVVPVTVTTPAARASTKRWIAVAAVAVAISALALFALNTGGWRERWLGRASSGRIGSLAVLPLANLSHDPEQDYFADGMTEALITDLAQIGALKVISRTSVMKYKGTTKTVPEIARDLNVDGVIEGSVQRSGDRVKITAQLIQGATDRHVWAKSYDRDLRDVLALENDVAQAIADEIRVSITLQEQVQMARSRPVDPAAYDAYLQGYHYLWNEAERRSGPETAIGYFHQAIAKDPNLAMAYVGLADAHILLVDNGFEDPNQGYPKVEEATSKALEIDPRLGEAHRTMGAVKEHRWDWAGAEREYRLAIQFNPGSALTHHWYASFLSALGRHDEAIAEARRAVELGPLEPYFRVILAAVLSTAHQYESAVNELEKVMALDNQILHAYLVLGETLLQMGRTTEAIAEFEKAQAISPDAGAFDASLSYAYARAGNKTEAIKILKRMQAASATRYVAPTDFATVYAGIGEKKEAFRWLETAFVQRDAHLEGLKMDPEWDPLRSDPRFQNLLHRVGLTE